MSGFDINRIILTGNLTRDPELRHTNSGTAVCGLRIANNTQRKDQSSGEWVDKPNYFDVTIWGGLGEWWAANVSKGDKIVVEGRMEWREWEAEGGGKRQAYDVIADSVEKCRSGGGGKKGDERESFHSATGGDADYASDVPADTADMASSAAGSSTDDDIPF